MASPMYDETILHSLQKKHRHSHPYSWGAWSPVLHPKRYAELMEAYPTLDQVIGERRYQQNARYDIDAADLLLRDDINPIMKDFVALHTSDAFWQRLCVILGPTIRWIYPRLEATVGKKLHEFVVGVRNAKRDPEGPRVDVELDCKPGYNTPVEKASSVRGPHIDNSHELFAGLMYCRRDDDDSVGGNFIINRRTVEVEKYRWHGKAELHPADYKQYAVQPYRKNEACYFINTLDAVHSVTVRERTRHSRRLMNFVAEVRHPLFIIPKKRNRAP